MFGSHKKIGKEIGSNIKNFFFNPFYFGAPDDFNFSADFYFDKYIFGFIIASIGLSIDRYGGQRWDAKKKGECIYEAMKKIDESEILLSFYTQQSEDIEEFHMKFNNNDIFNRGVDDATTIIGVMYGILPEDDPDPLFQEAKKIREKFDGPLVIQGDFKGDSLLATIICNASIFKYIKENFL